MGFLYLFIQTCHSVALSPDTAQYTFHTKTKTWRVSLRSRGLSCTKRRRSKDRVGSLLHCCLLLCNLLHSGLLHTALHCLLPNIIHTRGFVLNCKEHATNRIMKIWCYENTSTGYIILKKKYLTRPHNQNIYKTKFLPIGGCFYLVQKELLCSSPPVLALV